MSSFMEKAVEIATAAAEAEARAIEREDELERFRVENERAEHERLEKLREELGYRPGAPMAIGPGGEYLNGPLAQYRRDIERRKGWAS